MSTLAPRAQLRLVSFAVPAFLAFLALASALIPQRADAADRDQIEAFLETTGFDVALNSIALTSSSAPTMLGLEPGDFGADWSRLTKQVFDTEQMHEMAVGILEQTLDSDILDHAVAFYGSDLGQRLVEAENASHMVEDDTLKQDQGRAIVAGLVRIGSPRIEVLNRMNLAISGTETALRALQEIQIRFLLAASAAGVVELRLDADGLRAMMRENEDELRVALQKSALAGAAYTYQAFSDDEVEDYTEALEEPEMQQVYELLNAVQYEIMANRFEVLARQMADLHPGQDI
ncbi:hypothetical protein TRL7639_02116 [Falsiruegeria litorea R37]|uniref:DUF2059 domain-containing protein n=1 Tax=Falsiruegeria litorea R37 TaxID=1200284 RepID=A0A1Y5SHH5_9RHOB|nr:DUF2059 domain-containing protein [Falsiruegeria litorea]SLN40951.1 hypothetical protein TRL7639_02116 [Falsiruegeria litorea R37]